MKNSLASWPRRRAVVVPAAVVLVAGGGAVAWGASGDGGAGYRTAVVSTGDVQQLLSLMGTVSVVDQTKARFRTAGTVGSVTATVGQKVTKGQVLATLDTGSLQDAVTRAKATLAQAKATLETDATSGSSTPTPTASPTPDAAEGKVASPSAAAQQAADRALEEAARALAVATSACTVPAASTPTPTATPTATAKPDANASCSLALADALHAEQAAARAQQALARALESATTPTTPTATAPAAAAKDSSDTSSPARITRDTAAVSAAQVALIESEADLDAVTLRAPISGTVASIPWTAGGTAAAGDAIVILGKGAVDVTVDVPASSIRSIRVGLPATVRADGASKAATGVVTRIGLLPTDSSSGSSSSSSTTYPVTVRVAAGAGLVEGGTAAVSIVVKTVRDAVVVPNSAVHGSTVDVLSRGKVTSVPVQTGAVGALVTQVTSGVTAGQTVVLADLGEALPTSSTTSNGKLSFDGPVGGFSGPPPGSGGGPVTIKNGG